MHVSRTPRGELRSSANHSATLLHGHPNQIATAKVTVTALLLLLPLFLTFLISCPRRWSLQRLSATKYELDLTMSGDYDDRSGLGEQDRLLEEDSPTDTLHPSYTTKSIRRPVTVITTLLTISVVAVLWLLIVYEPPHSVHVPPARLTSRSLCHLGRATSSATRRRVTLSTADITASQASPIAGASIRRTSR